MNTNLDQLLSAKRKDEEDPDREFLTIGDIDFPIPKSAPMGLVLQLQKFEKEGRDQEALSPDLLDRLLRLAFGNDLVDALYEEAFGVEDLPVLLVWVTAKWRGDVPAEGESELGEAEALAAGASL